MLVHKGKFYQNGQLFDTANYLCHKKKTFAGFTLNARGELSVFNHNEDKICHSSMNAGEPVLSAGELVIEQGLLRRITTYSGHYTPSIFTIYRTLAYFANKGIDVSQVEIFAQRPPLGMGLEDGQVKERLIAHASDEEEPFLDDPEPRPDPIIIRDYYSVYYSFSAIYFLDSLKNQLETACVMLQSEISAYQATSFIQILYLLKDIFTSSNLTKNRENLAIEVNTYISQHLDAPTEDFSNNKVLIDQGVMRINEFITKNNELSLNNGKAINSGRLHERLINCLEKLRLASALSFKPCYEEDASLAGAMRALY